MDKARFCKAAIASFGAAVLLTAGLATTAFADEKTAAEEVTTMATTAPLNLRDASSLDGNVMDVMPEGTSVPVYGMTENGWYHVKYGDKMGFCYYQYLNFEGSEDGTVHDGKTTTMYATAPLNVRTAPGMDAKIIGSFEKGASVDVIAVEGDWYKVKFGDGIGYSHRDYLK